MNNQNNPKRGGLILVGTPIGNLSDISPRALDALRECDFIAAEDTRVTLKLLNRYEIKKPLVCYYQHNMAERGEELCARMLAGETCCLVTDAGMPAISDPGELLVAQCVRAGTPVGCVPGPSAVVTALAVSGLPTGRFTFEGFLSVKRPSRRRHLEDIMNEQRTMVFYEAPHKLLPTLRDLHETLGDRRVAIVRELTKIHEEVIRTTLGEAVVMQRAAPLKGEIVLVVEGAPPPAKQAMALPEAAEEARALMEDGMSRTDAAREAARISGHKKGDIYKLISTDNVE